MLRHLFSGIFGRRGDRVAPDVPAAHDAPEESPGYLDYETWDGATTGESFPDLTTPATFSFARRFYRAAYRDLARLRGMPPEHADGHDAVFGGILGYLRGRIFLRDRSWAAYEAALAGLPGNPELDRDLSAHLPGYLQYLGQARDAHLQGLDGLDLGDLVDLYHGLENALFHRAGLTVATDMRVIRVFTEVTAAMIASGIDPEGRDGTLLFASDNLAGAAGTQYLMALASSIRGDEALAGALAGDPKDALARVAADPALSPVREGLEAYLGAYGHRGPGEMMLERPMPIDRPDLVVAQLQALVGVNIGAGGKPALQRPGGTAGAHASGRRQPATPDVSPQLARCLEGAREWIGWRERMRAGRAGIFDAARRVLKEIGKRLADLGILADPADVWFLSVEETLDYCEGYGLQEDLGALVALRRSEFAAWHEDPVPDSLCSRGPANWPPARWSVETVSDTSGDPGSSPVDPGSSRAAGGPADPGSPPADAVAPGPKVLRGVVAWPGRVEGVARVLRDPGEVGGLGGDILVADRTDPGWTPLFPSAAAIVVEHGNPLCHAAILARELKIPALVGVRGLLATVRDGDRLVVDATAGEVRILAPAAPEAATPSGSA